MVFLFVCIAFPCHQFICLYVLHPWGPCAPCAPSPIPPSPPPPLCLGPIPFIPSPPFLIPSCAEPPSPCERFILYKHISLLLHVGFRSCQRELDLCKSGQWNKQLHAPGQLDRIDCWGQHSIPSFGRYISPSLKSSQCSDSQICTGHSRLP